MEKKELENALSVFKEKFGGNFVVGGSLALLQHGFKCEPHDIDLEYEIKESNKSIEEVFKALNWAYENTKGKCAAIYPERDKHYRFELQGVIFDVWLVEEIDYKSWLWKDYIRYADIMSVLRKKKELNRPKDFQDILNYVSQLSNLL